MLARKKDFQWVLLFSVSIAAAGLSACSTSAAGNQLSYGSSNFHPIEIAESVERMELYARPGGMNLSLRDQMAVSEFLTAYGAHGDGPLYINVPAQMAGSPGVQQTRTLVSDIMMKNGLQPTALQQGQYQGRPGMPAPVIISYRRLKTVPKDCRVTDNLMSTHSGQAYPSFGCSASSNLAAMIGDPGQLIEPYPMTSPDMKRRMVVYDKYINGSDTAASRPSGQSASTGSN